MKIGIMSTIQRCFLGVQLIFNSTQTTHKVILDLVDLRRVLIYA